MSIKFKVAVGIEPFIVGKLVYHRESYSFDMTPRISGVASVLIDDLSLEVDKNGQIVSVWGICPDARWRKSSLAPPPAKPGVLFAVSEHPLLRGVSVRVNHDGYLPTCVDTESGWVHIRGEASPAFAVKIFPGVIVEINSEGEFSSLWLHPRMG